MVETMVAMVVMMVVMVAMMWRRAEEALSVLGPGIDWALFRLLSSQEALGAESEEPVGISDDRNGLGVAATVGAALEGSCGVVSTRDQVRVTLRHHGYSGPSRSGCGGVGRDPGYSGPSRSGCGGGGRHPGY